jgi:hypothetical protein
MAPFGDVPTRKPTLTLLRRLPKRHGLAPTRVEVISIIEYAHRHISLTRNSHGETNPAIRSNWFCRPRIPSGGACHASSLRYLWSKPQDC